MANPTLRALKAEGEELYAAMAALESKVRAFKEKLDGRGIDSFRTEETAMKLDSAQGRFSRQQGVLDHLISKYGEE
jgi:hypothetical protein